jgi:hypothetical protein
MAKKLTPREVNSPRRWISLVLCCTACAASGRSDRPPNMAPAPSSASVSVVGFDRAVKLGSDYVYANTGVTNASVASSQTLPGGMLAITYDLGPGVPEPVRLVVDPNKGRVSSNESAEPIPGVIVTAPKQ